MWLIWTGDFVLNEPHGQGMMTWPSGDVYKGNFVSGKPNGFGILTLVTTGQRYQGISSPFSPHFYHILSSLFFYQFDLFVY
jgi:hypothetical protein